MSADPPELSLVMPCYNEAAGLPAAVLPLMEAVGGLGVPFEVLLVDNGSADATRTVIDRLAGEDPRIRRVDVAVNRGYGNGVLAGLAAARGARVAFLGADGQVPPEQVAGVLRQALVEPPRTLVKALRKSRGDGWRRRIQSRFYNLLFGLLLPVRSRDLNATPKVLHAADLVVLKLASEDWFLDPECMIRAAEEGFRVVEVPVDFLAREAGRSHVRASTALEFLGNLHRWKRRR